MKIEAERAAPARMVELKPCANCGATLGHNQKQGGVGEEHKTYHQLIHPTTGCLYDGHQWSFDGVSLSAWARRWNRRPDDDDFSDLESEYSNIIARVSDIESAPEARSTAFMYNDGEQLGCVTVEDMPHPIDYKPFPFTAASPSPVATQPEAMATECRTRATVLRRAFPSAEAHAITFEKAADMLEQLAAADRDHAAASAGYQKRTDEHIVRLTASLAAAQRKAEDREIELLRKIEKLVHA